MKISAETLSILSSFSSINPVMYFGDPKAIISIRSNSCLIGVFQPKETFDKQCAFYEIPQLLAVIDSMGAENAELDFNESFVKITNVDNAHVNYLYTPIEVISKNNPKPKDFETYCKPVAASFSFDITKETIAKILKLAKIMNLNTLQFKFEENKGTIHLLEKTGSSSAVGHTFDMNIEGNGSGYISFDITNLNIINGDYHIDVKMVNDKPVYGKWTNKNIPLFYIIGALKSE